MKIIKQNGDILELTVAEYKELIAENKPLVPNVYFPDIPGDGYISTTTLCENEKVK